ncbi:hypothetical protein [Clostridium saccharoperbutylacetonicum]
MDKINLFWPVYKNLEKELLKLSEYIHFSDDQTKVYSMHIADLIVRCSIEIEAISKEMYIQQGGKTHQFDNDGKNRDLYFDTDCIDLLEQEWHLSRKEIKVSASEFYFLTESNRILNPLYKANKRGSSGSKWKKAYQALKHNRKDSIKMGNIENLIDAMGALYILNLYYKDETFNLGRAYLSNTDFDERVGSDIFSTFTYVATALSMSRHMDDKSITPVNDVDLDKSIYIIKYDDYSFKKMSADSYKDNIMMQNNFRNSPIINRFLKENPEYEIKSIYKACLDIGGESLYTSIRSSENTMNGNIYLKKEAKINKNTAIYPVLSFPEI